MFDIAINNLGDLAMAPNGDIGGVSGREVIRQRIRLRLLIARGSWPLDPSNGLLGSRLYAALRSSVESMEGQADHFVREALAPMLEEISISEVKVERSPQDAGRLNLIIIYEDVVEVDRLGSDPQRDILNIELLS